MFTSNEMDNAFQALANATRRVILDNLAVLEKAELVVSQKEGRVRRLYLNVMPIQMIYERWTDEYQAHWASKLSQIKYAAEREDTTRGKK